MRTEKEMLDLIISVAQEDEHIRAVVMNGSRANPNAPRDFFQDFDIVYYATDIQPYRHNLDWIRRFGELMILQEPEEMTDPPPKGEDIVAYLMQFMDGNRIDLGVFPLERLKDVGEDSLTVVLLDKDEAIPPLPPPSERDYLPKPPSARQFADCCNEFWWVCPYAAKGLWRGEILYAREMMEVYIRPMLMKMLRWQIGFRTGFTRSPGKLGKYFRQYLEAEEWELLLATCSSADEAETWQALFRMAELFRRVAAPLAKAWGFDYPFEDDRRVSAHLQHVAHLPRDAPEMY